MANQFFARIALTGGTTGALDAIDGSRLADGDMTFVMSSGGILYPYRVNATSGAAEASPTTISPNTNAGDKRHILATLAALGLQFPATQVASAGANTLDDYEEGSWTMGISFGGGVTGMTYTSQLGYYVKIGCQCFFTGRINLSAKGSSTGTALITGLPFTSYSAYNNAGAVALRLQAVTFANMHQGFIAINTATISLIEVTTAGAESALDNTNFIDTSVVCVSGHYRVA
jgi:hypothetical protein